jgi:hypothetical protein
MNTIGHPFVTFKAVGRFNPYLAAGSILPDLVPFVVHEKELFRLLHEGGENFLAYLRSTEPTAGDLALGMLAHGVTYGADRFNRDIEQWLLGENNQRAKSIARQIMDCSKVSYQVARRSRLHNYLWAGLDLYLLDHEPDFISRLRQTLSEVTTKHTALLLADYLHRSRSEVNDWVGQFFAAFSPEAVTSRQGLVTIWQKEMAGLPEKDRINKRKTLNLFDDIAAEFADRWPAILDRVITAVTVSIRPFTRELSGTIKQDASTDHPRRLRPHR